jgi:hypothetical protein
MTFLGLFVCFLDAFGLTAAGSCHAVAAAASQEVASCCVDAAAASNRAAVATDPKRQSVSLFATKLLVAVENTLRLNSLLSVAHSIALLVSFRRISSRVHMIGWMGGQQNKTPFLFSRDG